MKRTMIILLGILYCLNCRAQQDSLLVVFWNVENFFDYDRAGETVAGRPCPPSDTLEGGPPQSGGGMERVARKSPVTVSPTRQWAQEKRWTRRRFEAKCNGIAKTIFRVSDAYGRFPDAVAFCEIGSRRVLERLVGTTLLRKLGYRIVHFDSPDRRGIDCALLYRSGSLNLVHARPEHIRDSLGNLLQTRDILLAQFDSSAILVNHHPSKLGDGSAGRREMAMRRLREVCDSLEGAGARRWLAVGDFNDDLWYDGSHGTIKYNGAWEKIDGHFSHESVECRETVFADPSLLVPDRGFGGMKPRRTYVGPRYEGGISDHLPIVLEVFFR